MTAMLKRLLDVVISLSGLVLFFPLFLLIAVFIKLDSKGPIFFRQERVGQDFKQFRIYKFRTMNLEGYLAGSMITVQGDGRITRVGRILRKTKTDELPQFINVLKGEMSIVGPRPEIPKYVDMFERDYIEILKIRPGITDYAAIEFSDEESILAKYDDPEKGYREEVLPRKIVLYNKYLKERDFWVDMKIIGMTIAKLLRRQ